MAEHPRGKVSSDTVVRRWTGETSITASTHWSRSVSVVYPAASQLRAESTNTYDEAGVTCLHRH